MPTLVAQVTQAEERGRALGWVHLWWNLGMVLGGMVGGAMVERRPGAPFAVAGVLNAIAIILAVAFFRLAATQRVTAAVAVGTSPLSHAEEVRCP